MKKFLTISLLSFFGTSLLMYGLYTYGSGQGVKGLLSKANFERLVSSADEKKQAEALRAKIQSNTGDVLAEEDSNASPSVYFNIPAIFNQNITAPNVVYGITAGANIIITGDAQNPEISVDLPPSVTTFQGETGAVTLTAGEGIDIDGTTITNTGIITLEAGEGIAVSGNTISNTLTPGWNDEGTVVVLVTTTDNVTIGGTSELAKLGVDGDTDEIQLLVQGNSTQTTELVVFENSSGGDVFSVSNSGQVTLGNILPLANDTYDVGSSSLIFNDVYVDRICFDGGSDCVSSSAAAGAASGFSDDGTVVRLTTSTDNVGIGTSTPGGKLQIAGDADEIQLLVSGNSSQTANLFVVEQSNGTDLFTISNSGNATVSGNASVTGSVSAGSVTVGGDTINDFTGTGLSMSGNSLTTTLGTLVSNTELENSSITFAGDSGSSATSLGGTRTIAGGTNGIDTSDNGSGTLVINFDSTEVGSTTWGSGSGITWTFDASAGVDSTLAFGSGTINATTTTFTITGSSVVTGTSDLQGNVANSTGTLTLADDIAVTGTTDLQGNVTDSTGSLTLADDVLITGSTTLNDAVIFNTTSVTFANDTNIAISGGAAGLNFDTNTLSIDSSSNRVGIGTTDPTARLQILGEADVIQLKVTGNATQTENLLTLEQSNGTDVFTVSNAGNVSVSGNTTLGDAATDTVTFTAGSSGTGINFSHASFGTCTSLETVGGALTCGSDDGGTASGWFDGGANVYLLTSTDNVGIGTTAPGGKLQIAGDADEIQFLVTGNSSQTANLFVVEQSNGTDLFTISSSGTATVAGGLTVTSGVVSLPNGQIDNAELANSSITFAGDSGSSATSLGGTRTISGGTNGIDTSDNGSGTLVINFDSTEVGSTTWGSGSGITWTFDASGGTDTSIAFGNNTQTFTTATASFSGNVGIGTTAPNVKLEVSDTSGSGGGIRSSYTSTTGGILALYGLSDGGAGIRAAAYTGTAYLQFLVGSTERVRINSSGNVGIGTTNPSSLLSVGSTSQFQVNSSGDIVAIKGLTYDWPTAHAADGFLKNDGTGELEWATIAGVGGVTGTGTANYVARWTGTSSIDIGVIYDNGLNVGIGTTAPTNKLDLVSSTGGSASLSALAIAFTQSDDADSADDNAGLRVSLTASSNDIGDVLSGIDISNISGGSSTDNAIRVGSGFDNEIYFEKGSNDVMVRVTGATGASRVLTIPTLSADADICTSLGNCLGGGAGGANTSLSNLTTTAINTDLLPNTSGSYNLGSGSFIWEDLYIDRICFDGGVDCISTSTGAGAASGFSDDGSVVRLTTVADLLGIGTTNPQDKVAIVASTNGSTSHDALSILFTQSDDADSADTNAGLNIDIVSNSTMNDTLLGINVGDLIAKTEVNEYAVQIGSGWDQAIKFADDAKIGLGNATTGYLEFDDQSTDEINFLNANVGIGTTAPTGKLEVFGSAGRLARFSSTGTLTVNINDNSSTSALTLANTQNGVDFGTNILFRLGHGGGTTVAGTSVDGGRIAVNAEQSWTSSTATQDSYLSIATTLDSVMAEKLRVTSAGNVGIGTTSPSSFKLEVAGDIGPSADNTYSLGSASRRWASIYATDLTISNLTPSGFTEGSIIFVGSSGVLSQDNANFYWNDSSNRLGLGTSSPDNALDVSGGVVIGSSYAGSLTASSNGLLVQGRVGIGTTNPSQNLEVAGNGTSSIKLGASSLSNFAAIQFNTGAFTSSNHNFFGSSTSDDLYISRPAGGRIFFREANSIEQLTLGSGGNVGINDASPTDRLSISASTGGSTSMDALSIAFTQSDDSDSADTNAGLNINITSSSSDADSLYGINIAAITASASATERALNIGSGWDAALVVNGTTVINGSGQVVSGQLTNSSITFAGDSGSSATSLGGTRTISGGTNGIDTSDNGSGTLVINFDSTEVGSTTWGSGSGITWTFDASAGVDSTLAFGSGTINATTTTFTITGSSVVTGTSDLQGNVANSTGTLTLADDTSISGNTTVGDASNDTVTFNASGITYVNDTNVTISGGLAGLNFDTSTLSIDAANDRVGIGTTAPENTFHVATTGGGIQVDRFTSSTAVSGGIQISKSFSDTVGTHAVNSVPDSQIGRIIFSPSSGSSFRTTAAMYAYTGTGGHQNSADMPTYLTFQTTPDGSGTPVERLRIDENGYIGIGTTEPAQQLEVRNDQNEVTALQIKNATSNSSARASLFVANDLGTTLLQTLSSGWTSSGLNMANYGVLSTNSALNGLVLMTAGTGDPLIFGTANTERARFDGDGEFGIGTTAPQNKLDVSGGAVIGSSYAGSFTAPSNGLLVQGNVGIGYTAPAEALHVSGNIRATSVFLAGTGSTAAPQFSFGGDSDTGMYLNTGGAIGLVGNAVEALRIRPAVQYVWISPSEDSTSASNGIAFGSSRDTNLYRGAADTLRTSDTLIVDSNLGVGTTSTSSFKIEVAGSVGPSADNTYDLGSSSRRWANLYATTINATNLSGSFSPSGFTQGSVVFAGTSGVLSQDNANFYWNDTNNRLGIGTTSPNQPLEVYSSTATSARIRITETGDTTAAHYGGLEFYDTSTFKGGIFKKGDDDAITIFDATRARLTVAQGGNVGIGSTSPERTLEIAGRERISSSVSAATFTSSSDVGAAALEIVNRAANGQMTGLHIYTSAQNSGTFLTSDSASVGRWSTGVSWTGSGVYTAAETTGSSIVQNAGAIQFLYGTSLTSGSNTSLTESMRISSTGLVGIGTTAPKNKLDISGGLVVGSSYAGVNTAPTNGLLVQGSVGIATTNPSASLHVVTTGDSNNTYLQGSSNANYILTVYNGGGLAKGLAINAGNSGSDASLLSINDATGTTNFFTVTDGNSYFQNGNVGIGTTSPSEKLEVANGDVYINKGGLIATPGTPTIAGTTVADATNLDLPSGVKVQGRYAYVSSFSSDTFSIFDISTPGSPERLSTLGGIGDSNFDGTFGVQVNGNYAYVTGSNQDIVNVVDISNPSAPAVVGSVSSSTQLDTVYNTFLSGKYLFAAARSDDRITAIDISNPTNPVIVGSSTFDSTDTNDPYSVYVDGNYAYVAVRLDSATCGDAAGETDCSRMTIFDVSDPTDITKVSTITSPNLIDIRFIQVSGRYAYVTGAVSDNIVIFDVSDPSTPVEVGAIASDTTNLNGPNEIVLAGKYAYVATDGDSFTIIDVSDPTAPAVHSSISSGTQLDAARGIALTGRYAIVTAANDDMLTVVDLNYELPALFAGVVGAGKLVVQDDANIGAGLNVAGAVNIGGNLITHGGISNFYTSSATAAGTETGTNLVVTDTGAVASGVDITRGLVMNVTRTGASGGTIRTTGLDLTVTGDGSGTSTVTGLNVTVSGADTNYAAVFTGGSVGIGTQPTNTLHVLGDVRIGTGAVYDDIIIQSGTDLSSYNGIVEIIPVTIPGSGTSQHATYFKNKAVDGAGTTVHNVLIDGELGIGTTNPGARLDISGGDGELMRLSSSNPTGSPKLSFYQGANTTERAYFQYQDSDDSFDINTDSHIDFMPNNTQAMRITSGGLVGIGTSQPSDQLVVSASTSGSAAFDAFSIVFTQSDDSDSADTNAGINITMTSSSSDADTLYGITIAGITGSGSAKETGLNIGSGWDYSATFADNVGIGTTAPGQRLEVAGGHIQIDNATALKTKNSSGTVRNLIYMDANNILHVSGDAGDVINIPSSGLVGIGTTAPSVALQVIGAGQFSTNLGVGRSAIDTLSLGASASATDITFGMHGVTTGGASSRSIFTQGATTGALNLAVDVGQNGSARAFSITLGATAGAFHIENGGNIGIGTTDPSVKLEVLGASSLFKHSSSSAHEMVLMTGDTSPTAGDTVSRLIFRGLDSSSNDTTFGEIRAAISDPTDASEDSALHMFGYASGTNTERLSIVSGNVGIGMTNPTQGKLVVAVDRVAAGDGPHLVLGGFSTTAWGNNEEIGALDFYNHDAGTAGIAAQVRSLRGNGSGEGGLLTFSTRDTGTGTTSLVEAMRIDTEGNVAIGTTSINTTYNPKLQLKNTATDSTNPVVSFVLNRQNSDTAGLLLGMDSLSNAVISANGGGTLRFGQNAAGTATFSEYMRITGTGVGIGYSNPNNPLVVVPQTTTNTDYVNINDLGVGNTVNGVDALSITFTQADDSDSADTNSGISIVMTSSSSDADTLNGINIIGITGSASANEYALQIGSGWDQAVKLADNAIVGLSTTGAYFEFDDQTTDEINFVNANVGIGTTVPSERLEVAGDIAAILSGSNPSLILGDANSGGNYGYMQWHSGTDRLFLGTQTSGDLIALTESGTVGIGVTNPSSLLEVNGTDNTAYLARIVNQSTSGGADGLEIRVNTASSSTFLLNANAGGSTKGLVVKGDMMVGIGTTNPTSSLTIVTNGAQTTDYMTLTDGGTGTTTNGVDGLSLVLTQTDDSDSADTNAGLNIAMTSSSSDADTLIGLNIADITGSASARDRALQIGSGWDANLYYNDTTTQIQVATGGTVVYEDADGTDLLSMSKTGFSINLDDTTRTERLCHSGADTATGVVTVADCTGTPGDYAEEYGTSDASIEAGDVVMIDPTREIEHVEKDGRLGTKAWIVKAQNSVNQRILGVISTDPNEIIGRNFDGTENGRPVALNGRVPVKVNAEGGAIEAGDFITSSSVAGVATKATQAGVVLGRALESWTPSSGKTTVLMYVNTSYADPAFFTEAEETSSLTSETVSDDLTVFTLTSNPLATPAMQKQLAINVNGDGSVEIPELKLDNNAKIKNIDARLAELTDRIASISGQLASTSGSTPSFFSEADWNTLLRDVDIIKTNQNTATLAAVLGTATDSAQLQPFTPDQTATLASLFVTGDSYLSNLGLTGNLSVGLLNIEGGLNASDSASISTLAGPLKLQSNGLNDLDIMNGKVLIDTEGNLTVAGSIKVKELKVDTTDEDSATAGTATLPLGQTRMTILTTGAKAASRIFLTPKSVITQPIAVTDQVEGASFTVEVATPQPTPVKFDWFIVN